VVVEQALRDVENPLTRQSDSIERGQEIAWIGLVAPDRLGRDDPVEFDAEPAIGDGKQVVIAIGDDAESKCRLEPGKRGDRIGERQPVADRRAKAAAAASLASMP